MQMGAATGTAELKKPNRKSASLPLERNTGFSCMTMLSASRKLETDQCQSCRKVSHLYNISRYQRAAAKRGKKWPASHFCLGPPTNGEIVLIHIQNSSSKRPRTDFCSEANKVQESKLKQPKGWTGSPGSHLMLLPITVQPEKGSHAKQRTAPGT